MLQTVDRELLQAAFWEAAEMAQQLSVYCSQREPECGFQHPCGLSHHCLWLSSRVPMSFSWLLGCLYWPHHAHIHTTKKKIILFIKVFFCASCLFLFHYLCVRRGWTTTPHRWESEDNWWELGLFPLSLILGIKLTSTGLAASVFTHLAI